MTKADEWSAGLFKQYGRKNELEPPPFQAPLLPGAAPGALGVASCAQHLLLRRSGAARHRYVVQRTAATDACRTGTPKSRTQPSSLNAKTVAP
eukprot:3801669-Rhodomonas_salina.1